MTWWTWSATTWWTGGTACVAGYAGSRAYVVAWTTNCATVGAWISTSLATVSTCLEKMGKIMEKDHLKIMKKKENMKKLGFAEDAKKRKNKRT